MERDQFTIQDVEGLKRLLVGKTISDVVANESDGVVAIEEIRFSDGSTLDLYGQSDVAIAFCVWVDK